MIDEIKTEAKFNICIKNNEETRLLNKQHVCEHLFFECLKVWMKNRLLGDKSDPIGRRNFYAEISPFPPPAVVCDGDSHEARFNWLVVAF